jgi:hypothetical protein
MFDDGIAELEILALQDRDFRMIHGIEKNCFVSAVIAHYCSFSSWIAARLAFPDHADNCSIYVI